MKIFFSIIFLSASSFYCYAQSILLPVQDANSKWGYINTKGEQAIPCHYDFAKPFSDGRGLVAIKENNEFRYSFIDAKDSVYGAWRYSNAEPYHNGYALVQFRIDNIHYDWGYIDIDGNICPPLHVNEARNFSNGLAPVKTEEGWGFMDSKFKMVIRSQYDFAGEFSEGLCAVGNGNDTVQRWCYINTLGQQVTPSTYLKAYCFSDHLAKVCTEVEEKSGRKTIRKKYYGFIGGNGDFLIPAVYQDASDFNEGIARVKKDGVEFFIDVLGNKIFELDSVSKASDFHQGYCVVRSAKKAWFIDQTGAVAYDQDFKELGDFENGYAYFTKSNGVSGYLDLKGNVIWDSSRDK
jgi:hypothetical protein